MNKKISLLALIVLAIPACQKKTPEIATKGTPCEEKTSQSVAKTETKPLFDEDVEGFVLEEPGNAFAPRTEESEEEEISIEKEVDEDWIDKRLEQTQQYGFKTIYFNFDEYSIRPDQKAVLDYDAKKIAELTKKGSTIIVEGHACRFAGNSSYNMMLSENRANSVANYLVERGIPREKMKIVGRGFELCVVPEGDMEQQAPNRRVEFFVLNDKAATE